MGRRAQANARTLSWAVRKVFAPVHTELPSKIHSANASSINFDNSFTKSDLIPTQLDDEASFSKTKIQKGKRVAHDSEDEAGEEQADEYGHMVQTKYRKTNLPRALTKCQHSSHIHNAKLADVMY